MGQRYEDRYCVPSVKHSPSIMIWGSISASGRGGISFIPPKTTVNAERYLHILQNKLPTWMNIRNCSIFQHEGAPAHNAKSAKTWLNQWLSDSNCRLLDKWPGSSPDLNVIENCWRMMKEKVASLKPTSIVDLKKKILHVWTQEVTATYCTSLVESMSNRIRAVL